MSEKKIYISEPEAHAVEADATVEQPAAPKPTRKKTVNKAKSKEEIPYEIAVARLEEIVRLLEQSREQIGLEESMKLYEEGVALVRRCYRELETAEQRVKVLQQSPDGEIQAIPFHTENESVR